MIARGAGLGWVAWFQIAGATGAHGICDWQAGTPKGVDASAKENYLEDAELEATCGAGLVLATFPQTAPMQTSVQ
jgi:hypothetical protein